MGSRQIVNENFQDFGFSKLNLTLLHFLFWLKDRVASYRKPPVPLEQISMNRFTFWPMTKMNLHDQDSLVFLYESRNFRRRRKKNFYPSFDGVNPLFLSGKKKKSSFSAAVGAIFCLFHFSLPAGAIFFFKIAENTFLK